jgi:hypothetical protein
MYLQIYDPLNDEVIKDLALSVQEGAVICTLSNGNFVVVSPRKVGNSVCDQYIVGYIFSSHGISEGTFNGDCISRQSEDHIKYFLAVTTLSHDVFVVVSTRHMEQDFDIYLQLYSSLGVQQGLAVKINDLTSGDQIQPSVATLPSGDFIVVWMSFSDDSVYCRKFSETGVPLFTHQRQLHFDGDLYWYSGASYPSVNPKVLALPNDNFCVTVILNDYLTPTHVLVRSFNQEANPIGDQLGVFSGKGGVGDLRTNHHDVTTGIDTITLTWYHWVPYFQRLNYTSKGELQIVYNEPIQLTKQSSCINIVETVGLSDGTTCLAANLGESGLVLFIDSTGVLWKNMLGCGESSSSHHHMSDGAITGLFFFLFYACLCTICLYCNDAFKNDGGCGEQKEKERQNEIELKPSQKKKQSKRIEPYISDYVPHADFDRQQEQEREVAEKEKRRQNEARQEEERIEDLRRYDIWRENTRYAG